MRLFLILTLEELRDDNSSWYPIEGYRIYLSAHHRYYGVKDPGLLFPVWVYEGELAPEFLDTQKAWKFYDRYPVAYETLESMPPPVADYLRQMLGLGEAVAAKPGTAPMDPPAQAKRLTAEPAAEIFVETKKAGESRPRFPFFSGILAFVQKMLRW